jgi:hypothetical protein
MGPPKKRQKKTSWSELLRQCDYFEYRLNFETNEYYYFNPYTGETIMQSSYDVLDRSKSMWADPDKVISVSASVVLLYPEGYQSRAWGRRPFHGWNNNIDAANHIKTVWRGYCARRDLSKYYNDRYKRSKCNLSGYLYYYDTYDTENEFCSFWYKPRLAFPWDIQELKKFDPEDHMGNNKYSKQGFIHGPYLKKAGLSKANIKRAKNPAFTKPNPLRDLAISDFHDIDLENTPIGSIIAFFDDSKAIEVHIDEYNLIKAAMLDNNWSRILHYMRKYNDNIVLQIFGMRAFASTSVDVEPDKDEGWVLTDATREVLQFCLDIVEKAYDNRPKRDTWAVGQVHLIFTLQAINNLFASRPARLEYFNTSHILAVGDERVAIIERFTKSRLQFFNHFLLQNKFDIVQYSKKGTNQFESYQIPTRRSSEIVEEVMQVLGYLGQEIDTREQMAELLGPVIVETLFKFEEDPNVMKFGLRTLYNFCYRAEGAQVYILESNIKKLLKRAHYFHAGEPDVARQIRRLELTLKVDGWRGNVEDLIEIEMKGDELDSVYLHSVNEPESKITESKSDGKNKAEESKEVKHEYKADSKHDDDDNVSINSNLTDD